MQESAIYLHGYFLTCFTEGFSLDERLRDPIFVIFHAGL